jgi:FAD/FMN-containing dehydrogenase
MHVLPIVPLAAAAGGVSAAARVVRRRRQARRAVGTDSRPLEACEARHAAKVARIAQALRARTSTRPLSLRKRAVSHQVPKPGDGRRSDDKLDITDLDEIIDIDVAARTCTAEPGVAFVDLVAATLRHGLVPIVVPELKTITLGGAVAGCSLESMSFVYGGFHDTCLEYEVITAQGELLVCTPENENALVFQMLHGTFGTLGILAKLKFALLPAKPFVRMKYERYSSLTDYKAAIWRRYESRDVDFMDGIIHSPHEYVLSLGRFADDAPYTSRYDWTKVYYQSTRERTEDCLRTPDYFFRYDRGVTNVNPKSRIGRLLFGKLIGSSQVLRAAEKLPFLMGPDGPPLTLDVFIPFSKVDAFLEWYRAELNHFPLWCVPYKRVRDYEWLSPSFFEKMSDGLFFDLAIYGMKPPSDRNAYKLIEEKLLALGGVKTLISYNYYSEEEFWKTWNRETYDAVKARTDPGNIFRNLYVKTCRTSRGLPE